MGEGRDALATAGETPALRERGCPRHKVLADHERRLPTRAQYEKIVGLIPSKFHI
jgi:hypothetical protein